MKKAALASACLIMAALLPFTVAADSFLTATVECQADAMVLCFDEVLCNCTAEWLDTSGAPCPGVTQPNEYCLSIPFEGCLADNEGPAAPDLPEGFEVIGQVGTIQVNDTVFNATGQCLRNSDGQVNIPIANGYRRIRVTGNSTYDVSMTLCRDDECLQPVVPPQKFTVEEGQEASSKFYVEVKLDTTNLPTELVEKLYVNLVDCWAGASSPLPVNLGYKMIEGGCALERPIPTDVYFQESHTVRFSTPSFSFAGTQYGYLFCSIRLCNEPDCVPCQGTSTARALEPISSDTVAAFGPFFITKGDLTLGRLFTDTTGSDLSVLIIGTSIGLALVLVALALTIWTVRRRSKLKDAMRAMATTETQRSGVTTNASRLGAVSERDHANKSGGHGWKKGAGVSFKEGGSSRRRTIGADSEGGAVTSMRSMGLSRTFTTKTKEEESDGRSVVTAKTNELLETKDLLSQELRESRGDSISCPVTEEEPAHGSHRPEGNDSDDNNNDACPYPPQCDSGKSSTASSSRRPVLQLGFLKVRRTPAAADKHPHADPEGEGGEGQQQGQDRIDVLLESPTRRRKDDHVYASLGNNEEP